MSEAALVVFPPALLAELQRLTSTDHGRLAKEIARYGNICHHIGHASGYDKGWNDALYDYWGEEKTDE
jgi:hypothetical protein